MDPGQYRPFQKIKNHFIWVEGVCRVTSISKNIPSKMIFPFQGVINQSYFSFSSIFANIWNPIWRDLESFSTFSIHNIKVHYLDLHHTKFYLNGLISWKVRAFEASTALSNLTFQKNRLKVQEVIAQTHIAIWI